MTLIGQHCFLCLAPILTLDFPEGEGGQGGEGTGSPLLLCLRCQGKVRDKGRTSELIRNKRARRKHESRK